VVKDILVTSNAVFQHTSGNIIHSGVLTLSRGDWRAATGDHVLGPLQLTVGPSSNSAISFPSGSSILRLANSSGQPWEPSTILYLHNWHGSFVGGGDTRLYFGSNTNGLTAQQLAQIQFPLSGRLHPARLLSTGEIVPAVLPPIACTRTIDALVFSWTGGYQLFSATNVTGPYVAVPGATSPFTNAFVDPQRFFQLCAPVP
jgi:hypothetical protein